MPKATTGCPLRLAKLCASAAASVTVAISFNFVFRPPGSTIVLLASCSSVAAPASIRMACSCDPTSPRPPVRATFVARRCFFSSDSGEANGQQPFWQERDAYFTVDAARALDLRDTANALERSRDDVVDEPGHLVSCPRRNRRCIGDDRHPFDVDALYRRFLDALRQLRPDVRHRVADVIHRTIGRRLQLKLGR